MVITLSHYGSHSHCDGVSDGDGGRVDEWREHFHIAHMRITAILVILHHRRVYRFTRIISTWLWGRCGDLAAAAAGQQNHRTSDKYTVEQP